MTLADPSTRSPAAVVSAELDQHRRVQRAFLGMALAMMLGGLDQTMIATALDTIGTDLGALGQVHWIVAIYLLATTAMTPLYGKISDIVGRRPVYLAAIAIFVFGSAICALSGSLAMLIAGRLVQGIGNGGLMSTAQTIIGDLVEPKRRGKYQAYIATIAVTSSVSGPVLGGVLTAGFHWTAIFWINLPLGAAAFVMARRSLRHLPRPRTSHRLDVTGAALMAAAAAALLLGLDWGEVQGWLAPETLGFLGASAVLWGLFARHVTRVEDPFLPVELLANRIVRCACGAAFFTFGTIVGLTMITPMYVQGRFGLDLSASGMALVALSGGTITGGTLSGRLTTTIHRYQRIPALGLLIAAAGFLVLSLGQARLPFWAFETILAVIGLGLGTLLPVATLAVQNEVAADRRGTATALLIFVRMLGGAILVVILGTAMTGGLQGDGTGYRNVFPLTLATALAAWACLVAMPFKPLRGRDG